MTKENQELVNRALALAKKGEKGSALLIVQAIPWVELPTDLIRKIALIYSYCLEPELCESAWLEILRRGETRSGDRFMLGTVQMGLAKYDDAVDSFAVELSNPNSAQLGPYLVATAISMAFSLTKLSRNDEAVHVLEMLDANAEFHLVGEGNITKSQILSIIRTSR